MLLIYHLLRGTRFHSSQICWEFGWCGWMLEILILGGQVFRTSLVQQGSWLVGWLVSLAFEKEISLTWNSQEPNLKWVDGFHGDFHPIFSCNGSESSKWNNHIQLVVWSSRYYTYMPFCGWSKIIEWHAEQQQQNIQSSRLEVGTWLMKRFISISN